VDHVDSLLEAFASGVLSADLSARVVEHLARCERCAENLENLRARSAPKGQQPLPWDITPAALTRLSTLLDLGEQEVGDLLRMVADPSCWFRAPAEGFWVVRVPPGPRRSSAVAHLVRGSPGAVFPSHLHEQTETTLVLAGELLQDSGETDGPGHTRVFPSGSRHQLTVVGQTECVCCVVTE
jgi:anti-sigma factor ChrR (cupin superfamily)